MGTLFKFLKVGAVLFVLVVVLAGAWATWVLMQPNQDIRPAAYPWKKGMSREEVDRIARDLLSQMSLEEKINEMHGGGYGRFLLSHGLLGRMGIVYAGGNQRRDIPPLAFTDGPRGITTAHATCFPVAMARAATWDIELESRVGDAIGKEARAAGANYFGGLCLNLLRHPSWGRAQESYGEDPWLVGEMGAALMVGVQQHNVMVCAKHFALNNIEYARYAVDVQLDERTLREVYLPHFKKCVDKGLASIMSAYNKVRGEYCGHNRYLLTKILREDWGFRGFVASDWVNGLRDTLKGVRAGLDVEMPVANYYGSRLQELVEKGKVSRDEIDTIVFRILRTKLDCVTRTDPMEYRSDLIACREHTELAREVSEESMVLLKNQDGLLPLSRNALQRLVVVGELAVADNTGDHGSSWVRPPYLVTALEGIRNFLGDDVEILHCTGQDPGELRQVAGVADAVIVIAGVRQEEEGEFIDFEGDMGKPEDRGQTLMGFGPGGDRFPLSLNDRDVDLIRTASLANPKCVVVLIGGSAITMEGWLNDVPSVLMAWYFGMEGGSGLARVLFGEVNPGGKLPFTIPRDEAQLPFFDPFAEEIAYDSYHGYTLFDRTGAEPRFPFGFGLSYTDFTYRNLTTDNLEITSSGELKIGVEVTNRGQSAGHEVVQLYIGFENSSVERPVKLLRDFEKIALEPGETRRVELSVTGADLGWYNPEKMDWEVETMEYTVYVGSSSRTEDLLSTRFRVVEEL